MTRPLLARARFFLWSNSWRRLRHPSACSQATRLSSLSRPPPSVPRSRFVPPRTSHSSTATASPPVSSRFALPGHAKTPVPSPTASTDPSARSASPNAGLVPRPSRSPRPRPLWFPTLRFPPLLSAVAPRHHRHRAPAPASRPEAGPRQSPRGQHVLRLRHRRCRRQQRLVTRGRSPLALPTRPAAGTAAARGRRPGATTAATSLLACPSPNTTQLVPSPARRHQHASEARRDHPVARRPT